MRSRNSDDKKDGDPAKRPRKQKTKAKPVMLLVTRSDQPPCIEPGDLQGVFPGYKVSQCEDEIFNCEDKEDLPPIDIAIIDPLAFFGDFLPWEMYLQLTEENPNVSFIWVVFDLDMFQRHIARTVQQLRAQAISSAVTDAQVLAAAGIYSLEFAEETSSQLLALSLQSFSRELLGNRNVLKRAG